MRGQAVRLLVRPVGGWRSWDSSGCPVAGVSCLETSNHELELCGKFIPAMTEKRSRIKYKFDAERKALKVCPLQYDRLYLKEEINLLRKGEMHLKTSSMNGEVGSGAFEFEKKKVTLHILLIRKPASRYKITTSRQTVDKKLVKDVEMELVTVQKCSEWSGKWESKRRNLRRYWFKTHCLEMFFFLSSLDGFP